MMRRWGYLYIVTAMLFPVNVANAEALFDDLVHEIDYITERDKIIAKNIANSDTPHYMPEELEDFPQQNEMLKMAITSSEHMVANHSYDYRVKQAEVLEIKPNGNGVNVNLEMQKKGENAMKLHELTTVYTKMRGLMKTAINGSGK
jgi:flagellar basal-body rod protein FlgB